MKYTKREIVICLALIVITGSLSAYMCYKYEEDRTNDVHRLVTGFCQALVDRDYDRACAIMREGPEGRDYESAYFKDALERFLKNASHSGRHPAFKELKHFEIIRICKIGIIGSDFVNNWNKYDAYVNFYSTDEINENLSEIMILELDKTGNKFQITHFCWKLGLIWPNDPRFINRCQSAYKNVPISI